MNPIMKMTLPHHDLAHAHHTRKLPHQHLISPRRTSIRMHQRDIQNQ